MGFALGLPLFVTGPLCKLLRHDIPSMCICSTAALDSLVRGWKYEIVFDRGCLPAVHEDLASHMLINIWSVALGLVALVYAGSLLV